MRKVGPIKIWRGCGIYIYFYRLRDKFIYFFPDPFFSFPLLPRRRRRRQGAFLSFFFPAPYQLGPTGPSWWKCTWGIHESPVNSARFGNFLASVSEKLGFKKKLLLVNAYQCCCLFTPGSRNCQPRQARSDSKGEQGDWWVRYILR